MEYCDRKGQFYVPVMERLLQKFGETMKRDVRDTVAYASGLQRLEDEKKQKQEAKSARAATRSTTNKPITESEPVEKVPAAKSHSMRTRGRKPKAQVLPEPTVPKAKTGRKPKGS